MLRPADATGCEPASGCRSIGPRRTISVLHSAPPARARAAPHLEEAITAYRDALMEWTRERMPLGWAQTQNNLGSALQELGTRESGTAHLEEAATAYRNALLEITRERVPLGWAQTQNSLNTAEKLLIERQK